MENEYLSDTEVTGRIYDESFELHKRAKQFVHWCAQANIPQDELRTLGELVNLIERLVETQIELAELRSFNWSITVKRLETRVAELEREKAEEEEAWRVALAAMGGQE